MMIDPVLLDRIYEASIVRERWPALLQDIADEIGARGASIVTRSPKRVDMITSPAIREAADAFLADGWGNDTDYTRPLFEEAWPGFRSETAYRTPEQIAALPVHAEFLDPRGFFAGASTVVQGAGDRLVHIAFEGFPDHPAAEEAISHLDALRPHLARAVSLTALQRDRSNVVTDSLALAGIPAAIVSGQGHLRSANALFSEQMRDRVGNGRGSLRFADRFLQARFVAALERHSDRAGQVQSIAARAGQNGASFAIHILPLIGAARDYCETDGILLILADATNASVPGADLLRLMFDLTPAEARITRALLEGRTVAEAASDVGVTDGTARTHLHAVFAKTGTSRQADLIRLLIGTGPPV